MTKPLSHKAYIHMTSSQTRVMQSFHQSVPRKPAQVTRLHLFALQCGSQDYVVSLNMLTSTTLMTPFPSFVMYNSRE